MPEPRPRPPFRLPFLRAQLDRELDDELAFHVEMRAEALRARGLSADEARAEALRQFGDVDDARRYCRREDRRRLREDRRVLWLDDLHQDARIAWRRLRRSPAFALAAVLMLAVGIGVTTAVYSVVHAYLVRPLPYPHADRLVSVIAGPPGEPAARAPSLRDVDWRAVEPLFETTVAWDLDGFTLAGGDAGGGGGGRRPEYVDGAWVSPGYLPSLGMSPAVGRAFRPEEYAEGAPVAVISDALWARRFGRDRALVGRAVRMYSTDRPRDADLVTIVGVMPPARWHVNRFTDVLRPLAAARIPSIARLHPGTSLGDAEARLNAAVLPQLGAVDPAWRMTLVSVQAEYTREVRPVLLALMVGSAFMLLIAAASVAGALVARAAARRLELDVRAALGASRGRIVRQLLAEGVVLAAIAAVVGTLLATLLLELLGSGIGEQLGAPVPGAPSGVTLNARVLALTVCASAAVGVAFGLLPAVTSGRADGGPALRGDARGAVTAARATRLRRALIASQLALATALLVGAGLMTRTALALAREPLGFRAAGVVKGNLLFPLGRFPDAGARRAGAERALAAVAALPGVRAAALAFPSPYRPAPIAPVVAEGRADDGGPRALPRTVTPGYFAVTDVVRVAGRTFDARDVADAVPVALVSERLARSLWAGASPLGRRLRVGADSTWRAVVGVVRDTRKPVELEQVPDVYVPYAQNARAYVSVLARTSDPQGLVPGLHRALAGVDDALAVSDVEPMEAVVARDGSRHRALAALLATFAAFALGLAVLGLYSSLAYVVSQRRRELAVRAAVGARASTLMRLVLREGALVTAAGVLAGAALSVALRRVLASQLYGVSAADPVNLAAIAALLAAAAAVATAVPAWRAARTDPAAVLRSE